LLSVHGLKRMFHTNYLINMVCFYLFMMFTRSAKSWREKNMKGTFRKWW